MFQKISILVLSAVLLFSCNNDSNQKKNKAKKNQLSEYAQGQKRLRELHTTFIEKELTKQDLTSDKDTITAVAFGHIYPLYPFEEILDSLIAAANKQNPDYVWIMGDIVFNNAPEEWEFINKKFEKLKGKKFYAGGNHDTNYHYERWEGKTDHEWEAETRFLKNVGYRYLTMEDQFSNYMILNLNDSIHRIREYMNTMKPKMNPDKPSILLTHQAIWTDSKSDPNDPHKWPQKSFNRDSILGDIAPFDILVDGDWNKNFYDKQFKKFRVIGSGNRIKGDDYRVTLFKITKDTVIITPIEVPIDPKSKWFEKKK